MICELLGGNLCKAKTFPFCHLTGRPCDSTKANQASWFHAIRTSGSIAPALSMHFCVFEHSYGEWLRISCWPQRDL